MCFVHALRVMHTLALIHCSRAYDPSFVSSGLSCDVQEKLIEGSSSEMVAFPILSKEFLFFWQGFFSRNIPSRLVEVSLVDHLLVHLSEELVARK